MTWCTRKALSFASVGRREVVTDFHGGRLTRDAEILLLKEIDRQSPNVVVLGIHCDNSPSAGPVFPIWWQSL